MKISKGAWDSTPEALAEFTCPFCETGTFQCLKLGSEAIDYKCSGCQRFAVAQLKHELGQPQWDRVPEFYYWEIAQFYNDEANWNEGRDEYWIARCDCLPAPERVRFAA